MATFSFELVSPTRLVFSGEVDQVDVPGAEGDFGVLAGHAPFVATLRPGILKVYAGGKTEQFIIFGGFAEVSAKGLSILAEQAGPVDNAALVAEIPAVIDNLQKEIAATTNGAIIDRENKRLSEFVRLSEQLSGGGVRH
jgi:F-type H+-transporting ATPase subunit epsilon